MTEGCVEDVIEAWTVRTQRDKEPANTTVVTLQRCWCNVHMDTHYTHIYTGILARTVSDIILTLAFPNLNDYTQLQA